MARKRKYQQVEAADYGTREMARHFTIIPKLIDNNTRAGRVLDGTAIDALLMNDVIDPMQHATLTMLANRLHSYGFVGLKSPDYSSPIHADPTQVSEKKAQALRGAVHLIEKMDKHPNIGRYRRKKLVNLALMDAPWGKLRHQIEDLRACIAALDHIFARS